MCDKDNDCAHQILSHVAGLSARCRYDSRHWHLRTEHLSSICRHLTTAIDALHQMFAFVWPAGKWTEDLEVERSIRKSGESRGGADYYYVLRGVRLRSKPEVLKHLGPGPEQTNSDCLPVPQTATLSEVAHSSGSLDKLARRQRNRDKKRKHKNLVPPAAIPFTADQRHGQKKSKSIGQHLPAVTVLADDPTQASQSQRSCF